MEVERGRKGFVKFGRFTEKIVGLVLGLRD